MQRVVPIRCGSAPRFSQPLSGFLACPGFAALSRAAAARGVLPSERSSSPGSRAPLGVAVLPCSSPPNANPRARTRSRHSGFHRRPRREARWPGSPPELEASFPPRVRVRPHRLPRHLEPRSPTWAERRVGFGCFEALIPPRSRTADRGRSHEPRPLLPWASPLQSLAPIEPRGLMTRRTVPSTAR